jgi:Immunoglobulin-like domain of bacterial spore germination
MKNPRAFTVILLVFLAAMACNLSSTAAPTQSQPEIQTLSAQTVAAMQGQTVSASQGGPDSTVQPTTEPAATNTLAVPPLTEAMLRNGTYKLPEFGETVTLIDGKYDRADSMDDLLHVQIVGPIAFGDLNGDGVADAAVLLSENGGGTGFFVSVIVMLNQGGVPVQSASRLIDDRPQINGTTILNGRIAVDAVIHGVQDPMCCPTFPVVETMRLWHERLALVSFASSAGGQSRTIAIAAPQSGSTASGSVQVAGSYAIPPFENTFGYMIFDAGGNMLGNGSFVTGSTDPGPGTFHAMVSLAGIPAGEVMLEIVDLSAADGSLLAMDSVFLTIQ